MDKHGDTLLIDAALHSTGSMCQSLIECGAHVNLIGPKTRYSALSNALRRRSLRLDRVPVLLSYGAQLGGRYEKWGWGVFVEAIENNNPNTLELLLDQFDKHGHRVPWERAVTDAMLSFHENCAMVIVRRGYHLHNKSSPCLFKPFKSFFHAVASIGYIELMKFLIQTQPTVLQEEWVGRKQFTDICQKRCPDIIPRLSENRPVPLKDLCRQNILVELGPQAGVKISKLPLPSCLKSFLSVR